MCLVRNRSLAPSTINCQWLVNAFINCSQTILSVQPKEPWSSWTKAKWKLCQFISGLHYNFIISQANSSWWIHIRYNLLGSHSLRIFKCPLVLLSKIIPRIVFELSELIAVSIRKVINSIEWPFDLELCLLRNHINLRPWPITQSTCGEGGCVSRRNLGSSPAWLCAPL